MDIMPFSDVDKATKSLFNASGKVIKDIKITEDDKLIITFDTGMLIIWDAEQACCEYRYIHTDDDIKSYIGSQFVAIDQRDIRYDCEGYCESHDIGFLLVLTSRGVFTIETHNEHNGFYSGFVVAVEWKEN